jgi:hypothetical protein
MVADLARWLAMGPHAASLAASEHLLDAALCTLAAADFHAGRCIPPPRTAFDRVHPEGWIRVRAPAATGLD